MRDHINALLKNIESPAAPLLLNEQQSCSVLVDGELECNIELDELGERLYLHSPIVRLPEENLTEFFARLLRANCFGIGTDGGQLGICDRSGAVIYSRRYQPQLLNGESFQDAFDQFVAVALVLREDFSTPSADGAAERSEPRAFPEEMLQPGFRV